MQKRFAKAARSWGTRVASERHTVRQANVGTKITMKSRTSFDTKSKAIADLLGFDKSLSLPFVFVLFTAAKDP